MIIYAMRMEWFMSQFGKVSAVRYGTVIITGSNGNLGLAVTETFSPFASVFQTMASPHQAAVKFALGILVWRSGRQ